MTSFAFTLSDASARRVLMVMVGILVFMIKRSSVALLGAP